MLCRCGHPKHPAQCPAPEGCWCDSFMSEREFYRDAAGSRYWVRECGREWKITADGAYIYGPASFENCWRQLHAMLEG